MYQHVSSVSMATCIQSGDMLKTLVTWSHSFKSCPLSALAVMGEKDIFAKQQILTGVADGSYTTQNGSLPKVLYEHLVTNTEFTNAVSPIVSALCASLSRPLIPIIGPPGTGKTTALTEISNLCLQLYFKFEWKPNRVPWILITAWKNAAVSVLSDTATKAGFLTP